MHLAVGDFWCRSYDVCYKKEKSKGYLYGRVCYGVTGKISFLTISPHSQLIQNHDTEVHAPITSCFFDVFVSYTVPVFGNV